MTKRTWILQEHGEDSIDVLCNGRRLRHHLTPAAAKRYVSERRESHDRVFWEEPDGYRRDITREIR